MNTRRCTTIARCLAVALFITVTACSDDGDEGARGAEAVTRGIDGLLSGFVTRGSDVTPVFAVVQNGRFMAVDSTALVFYDGPFVADGNSVSSSEIRVYATPPGTLFQKHYRAYTETAALSAAVTYGQGWEISVTRPGSTETMSLGYDWDVYDRESALALVEGTWSYVSDEPCDPYFGCFAQTLTVAADGTTALANSVTNCGASGQLALLDPASNLYGTSPTAAGSHCLSLAGPYSGFATLLDTDASDDTLRVLNAKPDYFFAILFRRQ